MATQEFATLAGGCFWCVETVFDQLKGVTDVVSGYEGGKIANPTYEQVCTGASGHAEVVRLAFDPETISFEQILHVFFTVHDPTTLNRQGNDVGTQYRSAIFYHTPEQKETAERVISVTNQAKLWAKRIVTEVSPATDFYEAEAYHQEYYARNPNQGYCRAIIEPKVAKFRKQYLDLLKR